MTEENKKNGDVIKDSVEAAEEKEEICEAEDTQTPENEAEPEAPDEAAESSESMEPEGEPDAESEDSEQAPKEVKKNRWKKKDKKDEKIEELTDRLQRSMAEFDNYRKRTDKEKASMYVIGAKEIIEKILPVIDNFERGLNSTTEEQKQDAFVEGMDKVYKQLCKTLEDLGVKPIEALGKEFDPNLHNAVMHVDDGEADENVVVEEFQKGYLYKDFVVRHSMVKVAN